jgi:hypothetical protein
MADSQGIQSICNRFSVCENSDELAFERVIDLLYRGEGGLKDLPKTLPAQLHVNARRIDLKKRIQHITRRKQNVKKRFDSSLNMERHQFPFRRLDIDQCRHFQSKLTDSGIGL